MYDNYIKCCIAEFIGTFTMCLGVAAGTYYDNGNQRSSYIYIFAAIYISIISHAKISGGDFNPCVTLTKFFCYEDKLKNHINNLIIPYCVVQCIAAFLSFLFYGYITNKQIVFKQAIGINASLTSGFLMEFFSSFFTYLFIILVDRNMTLKNWAFKIFCCAACVATGMSIGCFTSGSGLNPAVGLGANLSRLIIVRNVNEIYQLWIFVFAPIVASFFASICFKILKRKFLIKLE